MWNLRILEVNANLQSLQRIFQTNQPAMRFSYKRPTKTAIRLCRKWPLTAYQLVGHKFCPKIAGLSAYGGDIRTFPENVISKISKRC